MIAIVNEHRERSFVIVQCSAVADVEADDNAVVTVGSLLAVHLLIAPDWLLAAF